VQAHVHGQQRMRQLDLNREAKLVHTAPPPRRNSLYIVLTAHVATFSRLQTMTTCLLRRSTFPAPHCR